jgi:hypothetical protein
MEAEAEKESKKLGVLNENGTEDDDLGSRRPVVQTGASSQSTLDV